MKKRTGSILFVGGGSGGHLAPLVPVIEAVHHVAPKIELHYAGQGADLESPIICNVNVPLVLHRISAGKLNRFLTLKHLGELAGFLKGCLQSWLLVGRINPSLVFSKGGAVSVPLALAAAMRGIPIYAHESDVMPGMANRIVARLAKKVFVSYPVEAYSGTLPDEKLIWSGQPVREEFYQPDRNNPLILDGRTISDSLPLVVVVGGSQGGRKVNRLVQGAWNELLQKAHLVHICGQTDYLQVMAAAEKLSGSDRQNLWLLPFVGAELPVLFQRSAIVISRAGGTIFELAATRTPTVLIPLSTAAQNHQSKNAALVVGHGAAMAIDERTATPKELAKVALDLLDNEFRRHALSEAIGFLSKPIAATEIAKALINA